MKKNKTLLILFCAGMLASGCTSFLNVEVIGKSTIESFFSEYSGAQMAGEGLHSELLNFYESYLVKYAELKGICLNINTVNADDGEYYLFNYSMKPEYTATFPRMVWTDGFSVITQANNIIYYVPKLRESVTTDSERKGCDKITGWGYFARAIAHFQLCNCYAQPWIYTSDASHIGIPVVDRVPGFSDEIPRKSVAEVYELVISDLKKAIDLMGEENSVPDCTYISSTACEALLARVYLYKHDYANAELYSKKVMDKMTLTPRSNYVDMFRSPAANPGAETILRLNSYDQTTSYLSDFDPTRSNDFYPDPAMYKLYDADDIRLKLLTYVAEDCEEEQYRGKSFSAVCKNLPYKSIADTKDNNPYPMVLRTSEMYLIHAEALALGERQDLAGAAEDLKALIARARGKDASQIQISCSSAAQMEELIQKERTRELCYEGHGVFDYLRRGCDVVRSSTSNAEILEIKYPDYRFILPIDQLEMEANDSMIQNEGYDK